MTDKYSQCIRVTSADGKNTVEQFLHEMRKRVDKGQTEFGVDLTIERITDPDEIDGSD